MALLVLDAARLLPLARAGNKAPLRDVLKWELQLMQVGLLPTLVPRRL